LGRALVLVSAEIGEEKNLLERIRSVPGVRETHMTYGVYDLIAIVDVETHEGLKHSVIDKIRSLPGLRATLTMVIVE
jgi:DNA-binding Lrp family transcriptional regulator